MGDVVTARSLRALRGIVASFVAVSVAAVSHTVGGGGAPAPELVLAMSLLLAPVATALVGRRLTLWRLALAVAVSQVAFHATFTVIGPGISAPGVVASSDPPRAATSGHLHGGAASIAASPLSAAPDALASLLPLEPLMLVAHVLAATATIALLHRGESALRALVRLVIDLVAPALGGAPGPVPAARLASPVVAASLPSSVAELTPILRRGPPPAPRSR